MYKARGEEEEGAWCHARGGFHPQTPDCIWDAGVDRELDHFCIECIFSPPLPPREGPPKRQTYNY